MTVAGGYIKLLATSGRPKSMTRAGYWLAAPGRIRDVTSHEGKTKHGTADCALGRMRAAARGASRAFDDDG
jgi:hypothetical protein